MVVIIILQRHQMPRHRRAPPSSLPPDHYRYGTVRPRPKKRRPPKAVPRPPPPTPWPSPLQKWSHLPSPCQYTGQCGSEQCKEASPKPDPVRHQKEPRARRLSQRPPTPPCMKRTQEELERRETEAQRKAEILEDELYNAAVLPIHAWPYQLPTSKVLGKTPYKFRNRLYNHTYPTWRREQLGALLWDFDQAKGIIAMGRRTTGRGCDPGGPQPIGSVPKPKYHPTSLPWRRCIWVYNKWSAPTLMPSTPPPPASLTTPIALWQTTTHKPTNIWPPLPRGPPPTTPPPPPPEEAPYSPTQFPVMI